MKHVFNTLFLLVVLVTLPVMLLGAAAFLIIRSFEIGYEIMSDIMEAIVKGSR